MRYAMSFVVLLLLGSVAFARSPGCEKRCEKPCENRCQDCPCAPTAPAPCVNVIVTGQIAQEVWTVPMVPVVVQQPTQIYVVRQPQILQTIKPELTYTRIGLFGWRKGWRYQWAAGPQVVVP